MCTCTICHIHSLQSNSVTLLKIQKIEFDEWDTKRYECNYLFCAYRQCERPFLYAVADFLNHNNDRTTPSLAFFQRLCLFQIFIDRWQCDEDDAPWHHGIIYTMK